MKELGKLRSLGTLLGRLCISIIFILAGISKFVDYDATAQYMASKDMTLVPFFLVSAAIVEIVAGVSLLLGFKTRIAAAALLLLMIPTTLIFHDFWNYSGAEMQAQRTEFLKNLAIFGGLLYVISIGGGGWTLDSCTKCCSGSSCKTKP